MAICFNPRAREGRDSGIARKRRPHRFQSTRPRGARRNRCRISTRQAVVSIHAPARGATRACSLFRAIRAVSIHAPARGATRSNSDGARYITAFQSTRPRGARLTTPEKRRRADTFQSTRPRGARRDDGRTGKSIFCVSIHAPARGATQEIILTFNNAGVSIHAPARGATKAAGISTLAEMVSIHAPARGATSSRRNKRNSSSSFNPRAREGRDNRNTRRLN